jgi:muramoyltetrapeptide carboxypeptidase
MAQEHLTMKTVTLGLAVAVLALQAGPLAAQPAGKLYVANAAGSDIHIIDTATNKVIKRVEVGPQPHGLVATPDGRQMFITIENTGGDEGELLWYDPAADKVTRRLTVGPRPNQPACTPDGKLVYVPCDDATWWVIDTVKRSLIKKIATGGRPHNTLCSADGKRMFLGPKGSYHVLIADTATHKLLGEIPLSDAPRPIVLSKDEKRLYANVDTLIGFEVADVERRKVIQRVQAEVPQELLRQPSRSHGIGLLPNEKELWMCDVYHDRTYVFDLTAQPPRQIATIVMQGGGYWMCFSPEGQFCYISERIGNTVAVIDTASRKTITRVPVGNMPKRVLFVPPSSAGQEWLKPRALRPGDTIALVAPAGPIDMPPLLEYARQLEKAGFKVDIADNIKRRNGYLAGTDDERAAELNRAIRDPNIKAIFACRGGYGLTRIIDRLDYAALRKSPKIVTGFSDLTALHLAIASQARLITFHSPLALHSLWSEKPEYAYSNNAFRRAVFADQYKPGQIGYPLPYPTDQPAPSMLVGGKAQGRLMGGNLTLICSTLGTPYAIEPKGNILFIEDVNEAPYRIDRSLSQLRLAGVLDRVAGVVVGSFTTKDNNAKDAKDTDRVLREYLGQLKVPVLMNFPVGHARNNVTMPHGALAELDADAGVLRLLENPVLVD